LEKEAIIARTGGSWIKLKARARRAYCNFYTDAGATYVGMMRSEDNSMIDD